MDYIGSHESINWLFILVVLSILQWIITLYLVYKNYHLLGSTIVDNAFQIKDKNINASNYPKENRISFTKDYFYIFWNIYPIIFYAFFYYLDTSWESYLNQIVMISGKKALDAYSFWFKELNFFGISIKYKYIDLFVLFFSIFLAILATFNTQIIKQKQFIKETNKLYWWDIRISKSIYWIRFIFFVF